jgi:hypothetical protein
MHWESSSLSYQRPMNCRWREKIAWAGIPCTHGRRTNRPWGIQLVSRVLNLSLLHIWDLSLNLCPSDPKCKEQHKFLSTGGQLVCQWPPVRSKNLCISRLAQIRKDRWVVIYQQPFKCCWFTTHKEMLWFTAWFLVQDAVNPRSTRVSVHSSIRKDELSGRLWPTAPNIHVLWGISLFLLIVHWTMRKRDYQESAFPFLISWRNRNVTGNADRRLMTKSWFSATAWES